MASKYPVYVTVKLRPGLSRLRQGREHAALCAAFAAGCTGPRADAAFRLCHFAIRDDELHLLVEGRDRDSLARGLQGLLVRTAKGLNRAWGSRGRVFADRYADRVLKTPRQVRDALCRLFADGIKFTSSPWFDGFRSPVRATGASAVAPPVTKARTALLTVGWRRIGLIGAGEAPTSA